MIDIPTFICVFVLLNAILWDSFTRELLWQLLFSYAVCHTMLLWLVIQIAIFSFKIAVSNMNFIIPRKNDFLTVNIWMVTIQFLLLLSKLQKAIWADVQNKKCGKIISFYHQRQTSYKPFTHVSATLTVNISKVKSKGGVLQ